MKIVGGRDSVVETNTMANPKLEFPSDILIRTLLSDKAFADRCSYNPILAKMNILDALRSECGRRRFY